MRGNHVLTDTHLTRRRLLLFGMQATGAGLAAGLLAACSPQSPSAPAATAAPPAGTAGATTAPAAVATTKPAGAAGGTLRVGHIANPSQLDAHRSIAGFDRHIHLNLYDALVGVDRGLRLQPASGCRPTRPTPTCRRCLPTARAT